MQKRNIKALIEKQLSFISPSEEDMKEIKKGTLDILKELKAKIKKNKVKAEVFVGGSFAKGTLIKKDKYDIDIFVRFDKTYSDEDISKNMIKIMPSKAEKVHGSRDYYLLGKGNYVLEIVPNKKIKKAEEAENNTDLSYFHVSYVKKKANEKIRENIKIAKSFVYFSDCYGAESYIRGFSGYSLEILLIYYKSFENFVKAMAKAKDKLVIDPEKHYKKPEIAMREVNEAKLQSPIILIDPTNKRRNALSGLSYETFDKFKEICKKFIQQPSMKFFEKKDHTEKIKNKEGVRILETKTDKQKGDIAGTKLKKFYCFFVKDAERFFEVKDKEFSYDEDNNLGRIYIVLKEKERIIGGPFEEMAEALKKFKKEHKQIYFKNKKAYALAKPIKLEQYIENLRNHNILEQMDISEIREAKQ